MVVSLDQIIAISSAAVALCSACFAGWSARTARKALAIEYDRRKEERTPRLRAEIENSNGRNQVRITFDFCPSLVFVRGIHGADAGIFLSPEAVWPDGERDRHIAVGFRRAWIETGDSLLWDITLPKRRTRLASIAVTCRSRSGDEWTISVPLQLPS